MLNMHLQLLMTVIYLSTLCYEGVFKCSVKTQMLLPRISASLYGHLSLHGLTDLELISPCSVTESVHC